MAYGDDIIALSPDHRFILDGDVDDSIGSANGTNSGGTLSGPSLCEGTTNSYTTNGTSDRIVIPLGNGIEDELAIKSVGGWFSITGIQNPPKSIYGEGGTTSSLRFILGWGNYLTFEVNTSAFTLQIFGDTPFEINRAYHLYIAFRGNNNGNEFSAFLDGVKQLNAAPTNRQPGAANLGTRGQIEFGSPASAVAVGGTEVSLLAPINGNYNEWNMSYTTLPTDSEIRTELFEKGARAEETVASDSQSNMQTALNAFSSTQSNHPCTYEVNPVTGGGNFLLVNTTQFDPETSIHYRYNGSAGTLTILNRGSGNATQAKASAPFGGSIVIAEEVDVTITCIDVESGAVVSGARVYVVDSNSTVLIDALSNSSGVVTSTYNYVSNDVLSAASKVRKSSAGQLYKSTPITGTITRNGLNTTVLLIKD